MNNFYAIKAENIPDKNNYDPIRWVIYVLCDETPKPVPGIVITGIQGELKDIDDQYPFLIFKDGKGDYGSACEDSPDRYFNTTLRSKRMKAKEYFTVTYPDVEHGCKEIEMTFRISEVVLLAGAQKRGRNA